MAEQPEEAAEIKDTDIVFDCPHCGKSLAIDYRGAGLTIQCTDCERDVVVPIPEGMELNDIDSSDEEQEIRIINLRRALVAAEAQINGLEEEVALLRARSDGLSHIESEAADRDTGILEAVGSIQKAAAEIYRAVDRISDLAREGAKSAPEGEETEA
jgi:transcription elongation factor Elf1